MRQNSTRRKKEITKIPAAALLAAAALLLSPAGSAFGQTGAGAGSNNYRIAAHDLVEIKVFQELDLSTQARVDADGTVNMPLVGSVGLKGRTVEQAAGEITRMLADGYLVSPQVTVNVLTYSKKTFTVSGQVAKPGTFEIPDNREITLVEAIAMAGDYTRIARKSKVVLKRADGSVVYVDGKDQAVSRGAERITIREGDVITVNESLF